MGNTVEELVQKLGSLRWRKVENDSSNYMLTLKLLAKNWDYSALLMVTPIQITDGVRYDFQWKIYEGVGGNKMIRQGYYAEKATKSEFKRTVFGMLMGRIKRERKYNGTKTA